MTKKQIAIACILLVLPITTAFYFLISLLYSYIFFMVMWSGEAFINLIALDIPSKNYEWIAGRVIIWAVAFISCGYLLGFGGYELYKKAGGK